MSSEFGLLYIINSVHVDKNKNFVYTDDYMVVCTFFSFENSLMFFNRTCVHRQNIVHKKACTYVRTYTHSNVNRTKSLWY